jgi:hypothetical protein
VVRVTLRLVVRPPADPQEASECTKHRQLPPPRRRSSPSSSPGAVASSSTRNCAHSEAAPEQWRGDAGRGGGAVCSVDVGAAARGASPIGSMPVEGEGLERGAVAHLVSTLLSTPLLTSQSLAPPLTPKPTLCPHALASMHSTWKLNSMLSPTCATIEEGCTAVGSGFGFGKPPTRKQNPRQPQIGS